MPRSLGAVLVAVGVAYAAPADNNGSSGSSSSSHVPALTTGSGLAYAESCQAELFQWRSSKTSFGSEYGHTSTSIFSSEITFVSHEPETPTLTSLITLCDGYPRAVGQWTTHNGSSATVNYQWTNTNPVFIPGAYPTPKPCEISPEDCELLWSSWTTHWNSITSATPDYNSGLLAPPCETERIEPSYSTNANGEQCDNCLIHGSKIRLLFWPVTTVSGIGDLCSETAETFTPTAIEPPRTIVTEGITLTSPTVAVSIGGLSRVDNCGTTVDHTIIPVLPEDVSSVQGARALFTHKPFNFADLNYKCLDAPDEDFVTTGTRTDCYQEVPASAYFTGYANAAGADWYNSKAFENRTIYPNYQPQVLPPNTITEAIRSLWGPNCYIHPDGIWDPPIALQQEASFPLPKYVPGGPTSYYTPHTDVAQPGGPTTPHVVQPTQPSRPTAEPQLDSSAGKPTGSWPTTPSDPSHDNGGVQEHDDGNSEWGAGSHEGQGQDDEHTGGGSGGEDASGQDESGSGPEIVHTTVITYTSAISGGSDGDGAGNTVQEGQVSTVTHAYTDGINEGESSPTSSRLPVGDDQDGASSATGRETATSPSPTSDAAGNSGASDGGGSNDGSISSAIQSGIGGGGQNDSPPAQQINAAISITRAVGLKLSALAIAISVFL